MKLKILLTGKSGQIGRELGHVLPQLGEIVALDRQQLDLAKLDDIRKVVREVRPRLIVNAAAYTAVDAAEADEAAARVINADAAAVLADEAKRIDAALVHYSTDYVFDGSKRLPYDENDAPNPINAYGRTKLSGEDAIRNAGVAHLIFRTAWVYGTWGRNFLLSILRLAAERTELEVVSDQVGTPTRSSDIARATFQILARVCGPDSDRLSWNDVVGTYHMTAAGQTNRYEFAKAILDESSQANRHAEWLAAATAGGPLRARRIIATRTDEHQSLARRPAYSVLSNARLERTFGVRLPDWRSQLHRLFCEV